MGTVHLVEGPVGAGKSTYAAALSRRERAPHLNLDAWMARLFAADRPAADVMPWYLERKDRCLEQIWATAQAVLAAERDVVLELGLIQRGPRQAFAERAEAAGHRLVMHVLDAPREVRRARVRARNLERGATHSMDVPDHVFELASDLYEPPDDLERELYDVRAVET